MGGGICVGRTKGIKIQKSLVQVLLQGHGGFHGTQFYSTHPSSHPGKGYSHCASFTPQPMFGGLGPLLHHFEAMAHTMHSHIVEADVEVQR